MKISKSHYDRLDQRRLWLTNRIEAKEKTGCETQHDKSERDALTAALAVLEVDPAPTYPPVPEGWRELESDEVIQEGDQYPYCGIGDWTPVLADVGLRQSEFYYPHIRRIEPAPKHPPVPEGWRLLNDDEIVAYGDAFYSRSMNEWGTVVTDVGRPQHNFIYPHIRRIEPTYRPFASAEEFDVHANRIVVNIGTGTRRRIDNYSDKGCMGMSWDMAFRKWRFLDDGSPFGVEVKP